MFTVPEEMILILQHFAPVFSERIWDWVQVLVWGSILTPRQRTVSAALRVMGLGQERQYQNYHRVLNRAKWSGLEASERLVRLLVKTFWDGQRPLILAADETLERRRGPKIRGKGSYRDAALSSQKYNVVSEGLRWVSMMLITPLPWSQRPWALPFLTVLAPHKDSELAQGKRHKTSIDSIGQMIGQVRRWLPQQRLVLVVDGGLVAVKLGLRCVQWQVTYVTRVHLNIRLFDPPLPAAGKKTKAVGPRQPSLAARLADPHATWTTSAVTWYGGKIRQVKWQTGTALWHTPSEDTPLSLRWVLVKDPVGKFASQAFIATDLSVAPTQLIEWYVLRWNIEVTFQEANAHLGFGTQRQWNDRAIARSTPALLGLFSLVTLLAHALTLAPAWRATAWYPKSQPTFADALALVRQTLWLQGKLLKPPQNTPFIQIPADAWEEALQLLAYAS